MSELKTIEDFPELDGFIGDNEYGDNDGNSVIRTDLAAGKFVEMQSEIECLNQDKLELQSLVNDFNSACIEIFKDDDFDESPLILIEVFDRMPKQSLAKYDKEVVNKFISYLKMDSKMDGITKLYLHSKMIKYLNNES